MRIQFTAEGTQQICALFKKRNAGQDDVRVMQFLHEVLREIYDIYSINFTEIRILWIIWHCIFKI